MLQMKDLTENERSWLEFLRMISLEGDPEPTLRRVQLLRRICEPGAHRRNGHVSPARNGCVSVPRRIPFDSVHEVAKGLPDENSGKPSGRALRGKFATNCLNWP